MPNIASMFPKRFLSHEDLPPGGQFVAVTIRMIFMARAQMRQGQGGQMEGEAEWRIQFAEYAKPLGMRKSRAKQLAKLLGSENTEQWIGRRIFIYAGTYEAWGEEKVGVLIAPNLPEPVAGHLGPATPAQPGQPVPDLRAIGTKGEARIRETLKHIGRTYDEVLAWLKANDEPAYRLATGRALDDLPVAVLKPMKLAFDALTARPGEVVNPTTGEVTSGGLSPAQARQHVEQIADDDIPF